MGHTSNLDSFLNLHKDQLLSSGVPEHFWANLYEKLLNQTLDAGNVFRLLHFEYDEERKEHQPLWGLQATEDINHTDGKQIYLIDHAWTFKLENAKKTLVQHDALRNRMCKILGLDADLDKRELSEKIFRGIWRLCHTYSIGNADNVEDRLPVWYVMDEIGSALIHSDVPNCRVVPFIFINEQITYSLLFPIVSIDEGDFVTKDFGEGITDETQREASLIPWVPHSFKEYDVDPLIPPSEYFLSGHVKESLPVLQNIERKITPHSRYRVFSQYPLVNSYLTRENFDIVEREEEADILWYTSHFKTYEELSRTPEKFINQFPFEYVITVKDLLSITCRRCIGDSPQGVEFPDWLPITYNLKTEIANFISCFEQRSSQNLENYWIIKPYNLARGMDTHITDNLNQIVRLATTGPKIVQKYITNPVLFKRPECAGPVKFDIRYVLLLKKVKPLEAYIYKKFFLRFANQAFELKNFDVYEKHFTVMNYNENATLKHMLCEDFEKEWDEQYSNHAWGSIEKSICEMLRQILEKATLEPPPCGIAENPQSRALYAADIMLEWKDNGTMGPKILEINWMPDCKRACEYYPDFYNHIFSLMFLDEESNNFVKL